LSLSDKFFGRISTVIIQRSLALFNTQVPVIVTRLNAEVRGLRSCGESYVDEVKMKTSQ